MSVTPEKERPSSSITRIVYSQTDNEAALSQMQNFLRKPEYEGSSSKDTDHSNDKKMIENIKDNEALSINKDVDLFF